MIRRTLIALCLGVLATAGPALAQAPLNLEMAVQRARAGNPRAGAAAAAEREAAARVAQAQSAYWPRIDLTESWQRGNQPVFVFSSLLAQRQFTAANFAIDALNRPDPVGNFRTSFTVDQPLFDGATRFGVAAARLGRDVAAAQRQLLDHELATDVTAAYTRVLTAMAGRRSAEAASAAARADRELAGNRRDAGLVTDADVLQLDLHVSRTREQEIRATADEQVARAQLNALMGEPLDADWTLDPTSAAVPLDTTPAAALEQEALTNRPDLRMTVLQEDLAKATRKSARAAFLPQFSAQAGWEVNGGSFGSRESSWMIGGVARINLFRGFADRARLVEATELEKRRAFEKQQAETGVRVDVRTAIARLDAARASETVATAAVAQAAESRRIIRDRYEAGLADITSLLRSSEAIVQAEAQQVAARAAVLTETASLLRALGRR
jgi:outer membrane protein TolC